MPSVTAPPDDLPDPGLMSGADAPHPPKSLEEVLRESALLHAMRASVLRAEVERLRAGGTRRGVSFGRPGAGLRLASGRAGHRVRFLALLVRRTLRALREEGLGRTVSLIGARAGIGRPDRDARPGAPGPKAPAGKKPDPYLAPLAVPAPVLLAHRVLIVAELSIPQCAKYRVWQKQARFERLGTPCTVVDWRLPGDCHSALQTHTLAILYRVPASPEILALIEDAKRLGVETTWEVDDLVFDVALYGRNANLLALPKPQQRNLLEGAALYRRALLHADRSIASTPVLAKLMTEATGRPSDVVLNALDAETRAFARAARDAHGGQEARPAGIVVVVYGSGTSTHDADFAVAAPALLRLMRDDTRIVLRLVGELTLDDGFEAVSERVERIAFRDFRSYLALLASGDIAIAPLEDTVFNDAKSNIKLLEASIVGVPSVCSPAREFVIAVEHGVDGFLARSEAEWFEALRALADDPVLRRTVGARAEARAIAGFGEAGPVLAQTASLLGRLTPPRRRARRILVVNIFFAPRSFGGATIVAEEMAERLAARADTEVFVFTSHGVEGRSQYTLYRYAARGCEIVGIAVPGGADDILVFDDPEMGRRFADVLRAVAPDVVHFHSIQHFGTAIVRACQAALIPYVVTLHDAWWLCQRQFMVRADNRYCYQTTIDLKVCERCLPGAHHLQVRMDEMMQALHGAALLLSPSASHAALYRANGLPPERLRVNRNGIRLPARPRPVRRAGGGKLRFGYVGGNEKLKGVLLIHQAFDRLERRDWRLVLVDNTLNLGFRSFHARDWDRLGDVEIVPAYRQETVDDFFENIDVLLFPSQWKESFGLTVREALVRDVWVIATRAGGAVEDIVDGENGTIVELGDDPEPFAAAIEAVLDLADRLTAWRNPHKARIATLADQAAELDGMIDEVLGRSRTDGRTAMAAEQQQQHDDHQQEHAEAATGPAALHGRDAAVGSIPAAPVTGVSEAAERQHDEHDQKQRNQGSPLPLMPLEPQ